MPRLRHLLLFFTTILALSSCSDEVNNTYTTRRAFFRFNAVITTAPLYTALSNPGEFCTISFPNGRYVFTGPTGQSSSYEPTAVAQYGKPECISGFIVGTPAIPDLSTGTSIVAYDLVCPNCYEENSIQRSLSFAAPSHTTMKCPRCTRFYDLNNSGHVSNGSGGRALFRYRITYNSSGSGTVVIQN